MVIMIIKIQKCFLSDRQILPPQTHILASTDPFRIPVQNSSQSRGKEIGRVSRTLSQCSQSLTKPHSTLISAGEKCVCVCVCVCVKVAQSCPTLFDPMDRSPPGFSVHGISQARILERVAISFSCWKIKELNWSSELHFYCNNVKLFIPKDKDKTAV